MRKKNVFVWCVGSMLLYAASLEAKTLEITGDALNVRSGPGRTYTVVDMVKQHEKFEILQEQEGWYQISVEGTVGWISKKGTAIVAEKRLEDLLRQADGYFYRQQFTTPADANAYDLYRQVLQHDPENAHALKRIEQMTNTYRSWADAAYNKDEYRTAKIYYQRYLYLHPDDQEVEDRLRSLETSSSETEGTLRIVQLRRDPVPVSKQQMVRMVRHYRFHHPADWSKYGLSGSMTGDFQHDYEVKTFHETPVILDYASNLMWQQKGPNEEMTWRTAAEYVKQLNTSRYAGFSEWRLPTIQELASLLEPKKGRHTLYLDPLFGSTPLWCWSADPSPASNTAWYVSFNSGGIQQQFMDNTAFVLAVRSLE